MESKKKVNAANESFLNKAKTVWSKYETVGARLHPAPKPLQFPLRAPPSPTPSWHARAGTLINHI